MPRVSLAPPSAAHWLGADFMGRDVYSRIVYGARISLAVGIGSTSLGCLFGVALGLLSGYLGGWVDLLVQRLIDILQALPLLVLALVMAAALGPSLQNTIIAIAIPLIPYVGARDPLQHAGAARTAVRRGGARDRHERVRASPSRHVLPNTLAPLIVLATAQLGSAILTEASLSFLGLGIPEPYPSWGRMLSESAAEYVRTAPWLVIFPGVAISLVVFGTNLLGDALRDLLDPRQRTDAHHDRGSASDEATRRPAQATLAREPLLEVDGLQTFFLHAAASSRRSTASPSRSSAAKRWRSSANPAAARA